MKPATTPPSKTSTSGKSNRKRAIPIESRQGVIAETAYYLAEKRGFAPGYELQDWLEAERIIQERFPEA